PATASCCALSPSPPIPRSPRSLLTATATTGIYTRSLHDALPIFISRDTGFDTLIKHLKERGIKVQRERDLAEIPVVRMSTATSRSEEHTSELQSRENLVCRLLLEKKKIGRAHVSTRLTGQGRMSC